MYSSQTKLSKDSAFIVTFPQLAINAYLLFMIITPYLRYGDPQIIFFILLNVLALFFIFKQARGKVKFDIQKLLWILFPAAIFITHSPRYNSWAGAFLKFALIIIFVCIFDAPIKYFSEAMKFIENVGVVVALSIIAESIVPNLFYNYFYGVFFKAESAILSNQMNVGIYSGITTSVASSAGLITFSIFSIVAKFDTMNIKQKWQAMLKIVVLALGMILTGKRSQPIFMLFSICVMYLINTNRKSMLFKIATLVTIFSGICIAAIAIAPLLDGQNAITRLVDTVIYAKQGKDITSGRTDLTQYAMEIFNNNKLKGIGWGGYVSEFPMHNEFGVTGVHNVYAQILCEMGMVGFISFIVPITYCLIRSYKQMKNRILSRAEKNIAKFSFCLQIFFAMYCFTDILLESPMYYMTYFYAVTINISLSHLNVNEIKNKTQES